MRAKSFNRFINESFSVQEVFVEIFFDYFKEATEALGDIDFNNVRVESGKIIFESRYPDNIRVGVKVHQYEIISRFILYPVFGSKFYQIQNKYSEDELRGAHALKLLDDIIGDPLEYFDGFVAAEEAIVIHPELGEILKYGDAEDPTEIEWLYQAWKNYKKNKDDGFLLGTLSSYIGGTLQPRNVPIGPHEIWTAIENSSKK